MFSYLNGDYLLTVEAKISALDRGFLYGDGVYETLRTYRGKPFCLEDHFKRLVSSATYLEFDIPFSQNELQVVLAELVKRNQQATNAEDFVLRVTVSRGPVNENFNLETSSAPTVFISPRPVPDLEKLRKTGMSLATVSVRRDVEGGQEASYKTTNYINNLRALREAKSQGADEALMLNAAGRVAECSMRNIFMVKDGRIITPALSENILPGVTRGVVCKICNVEQRQIELAEIRQADEIFLTSTSVGPIPVNNLDGQSYPVAGPVIGQIISKFDQFVEEYAFLP